MGTKKTETKNTLGKKTDAQGKMEKLLAKLATNAQSQMGNLSDLANGKIGQLSPEILDAITAAQSGARTGVQTNYTTALRDQQVQASQRGISGSSAEAIGSALLGQERNQQLAQLDSQAAQAKLQLPFQLGQQQLQANQLLSQIAQGSAGTGLNAFVQQRLGSGASTTSQSGFSVSDLINLKATMKPLSIGGV